MRARVTKKRRGLEKHGREGHDEERRREQQIVRVTKKCRYRASLEVVS
jgi:hypothetical protein